MAIFYFIGALYGGALHELGCIAYFLMQNISAKPKNLNQPLFRVCLVTFIAELIAFVGTIIV
jgi:hypothetical protein